MGSELARDPIPGEQAPPPIRDAFLLLLAPCSWLFSSKSGWLGLGTLVVVNGLTPGAGRGSECSFWLLPCAGWVGDLSEPPGQKDTGWMCGWSRVELLTMALKPLTIALGRAGRNHSVSSSTHSSPSVSCCSWVWECLWLASPAASAVSLLTLRQAVLKGGMARSARSQQCEVPYF